MSKTTKPKATIQDIEDAMDLTTPLFTQEELSLNPPDELYVLRLEEANKKRAEYLSKFDEESIKQAYRDLRLIQRVKGEEYLENWPGICGNRSSFSVMLRALVRPKAYVRLFNTIRSTLKYSGIKGFLLFFWEGLVIIIKGDKEDI